jgi:dTDP-glucose 4,6-dehydratase
MRLFVTGGAGFIGSALVRRSVRSGHHVLNVDKLTYAGTLHSVQEVAQERNYAFARADVADREVMRSLIASFQPDAILHLAAESHVDRSIDAPAAFMETNIAGTFCLLEEALRYWKSLDAERAGSFRFVHVSTDEVFGSLGATGYFDEQTAYDPSSPYSASKAAADHLARAWQHTYGLPVVVTNCSNNYGPYQFPEKLIPLLIERALTLEPLPIYGEGKQVRDWLYVDDHVEALLRAAQRGGAGETYLMGGRSERTNLEVAKAICRVMDELRPDNSPPEGRERLITFVEDRPGHDFRYAIDPSKAERELQWKAREDFESGIRKTVQWYLDNREWSAAVRSGKYGGERLGLSRADRGRQLT